MDQFRAKANQEAAAGKGNTSHAGGGDQQPDLMSMGSSFLSQVYFTQK